MREIDGDFSDYGARSANGSWTSYLGALQRDEIDMFVGPTMETDERRQDFQLLSTGT